MSGIEVQQNHVRLELVELLNARLAIFGFAADGTSAGTQDHMNDTTRNLGIIDNQNPKWHGPDTPIAFL